MINNYQSVSDDAAAEPNNNKVYFHLHCPMLVFGIEHLEFIILSESYILASIGRLHALEQLVLNCLIIPEQHCDHHNQHLLQPLSTLIYLHTLTLHHVINARQHQLQPFLRSLPSLPSLHTLHLSDHIPIDTSSIAALTVQPVLHTIHVFHHIPADAAYSTTFPGALLRLYCSTVVTQLLNVLTLCTLDIDRQCTLDKSSKAVIEEVQMQLQQRQQRAVEREKCTIKS